MKIRVFLSLSFIGIVGFSQQSKPVSSSALKQEVLLSKEVKDWQNAMISYQTSNTKLCALLYEQKLNQNLFSICGKHSIDVSTENFILQLFRTLRITAEFKDSVVLKEKALRTKYPQLVTHFEFDEIFPEMYAPVQKAREY